MVENDGDGKDIVNRLVYLYADTTVYLKIQGWMQPLIDRTGGAGHTLKIVVNGDVRNKEVYLFSDLNF